MAQFNTSATMDNHDVRDETTALKYLDAATVAERDSDRWRAMEALEAAFAADPDNPDTCFRLAFHLDLVGEEDEALHLYEQCIQRSNPHINALLNLAVMYEDRHQYSKAESCVQQVLSTDPNHLRARLYFKDIHASQDMIIEDEPDTSLEQKHALLDTPVTDFDLSVRTRNALRKMNVRTLGDLLSVSEADLRSYKNVGDSSLEEIKSMLAEGGLKLGQTIEARQSVVKRQVFEQIKSDGGGEEVFDRTVAELQLSVRARKALAMLNIQSIGDLCMRTEAELMGVKNFGMTSLIEIKERLVEQGLSLRELEDREDG